MIDWHLKLTFIENTLIVLACKSWSTGAGGTAEISKFYEKYISGFSWIQQTVPFNFLISSPAPPLHPGQQSQRLAFWTRYCLSGHSVKDDTHGTLELHFGQLWDWLISSAANNTTNMHWILFSITTITSIKFHCDSHYIQNNGTSLCPKDSWQPAQLTLQYLIGILSLPMW